MSKLKKELPKIDSQFHGSSHITKPGTNIFLDLGFPPDLAAKYQEDSKRRMADTLAERKAKRKSDFIK